MVFKENDVVLKKRPSFPTEFELGQCPCNLENAATNADGCRLELPRVAASWVAGGDRDELRLVEVAKPEFL